MNEKSGKWLLAVAIVISGLVGPLLGFVLQKSPKVNEVAQEKFGSVTRASEYFSTTTQAGTKDIVTLSTSTEGIYTTRQGTLGSVIITKVAATACDIFDATTTVYSQRTPALTTSSIRLATIPASLAVGVYTYDSVYKNGLIMVCGSDLIPSTTVTFR